VSSSLTFKLGPRLKQKTAQPSTFDTHHPRPLSCRSPCIWACTTKNMHQHVLQNPMTTPTASVEIPVFRACTNKNMHRHVLQNPITTLTYTLKKKKGFAVEKLQTDYLNGCTNENCMMRCNASLGMFTAEESPEYSIYYMLRMVSITHK